MSGLMMHTEKDRTTGLSLADLRDLPTPEGTKTHVPIPHALISDVVREHITRFGLTIRNEDFAVASWSEQEIEGEPRSIANKMFGVFDIANADDEDGNVGFSIGVRNSMNKTLPAGICFGARVFVCDNRAFSAEVVLKRRHTKRILDDLPGLVESHLSRFEGFRNAQNQLFDRLRDAKIDSDDAAGIIVEACRKVGRGFLSKKNVVDILDVYNAPPRTGEEIEAEIEPSNREQHGYGTAWSLYNAGTRFARTALRKNMVEGSHDLLGWNAIFANRFGMVKTQETALAKLN